jgi:hypothetical protein
MHRTGRAEMLRPGPAMFHASIRQALKDMLRFGRPLIRGASPPWTGDALRSRWPEVRRPIGKCCAPANRPRQGEVKSSDSPRRRTTLMRSACADQPIAATTYGVITCTQLAGLRSGEIPAHVRQYECAISRPGDAQRGHFECCAAARKGCSQGFLDKAQRAFLALLPGRNTSMTGGNFSLLGKIAEPPLRRSGGFPRNRKLDLLREDRPGLPEDQAGRARSHAIKRSPVKACDLQGTSPHLRRKQTVVLRIGSLEVVLGSLRLAKLSPEDSWFGFRVRRVRARLESLT